MNRLSKINFLVAAGGAFGLLASSGCGTHTANVDVGTGVEALVCARRMHTTVSVTDVSINIAGGTNQVIDYNRYVPGGGVYVLSPARPDGNLKNLTAGFPEADISGLDLSFDATEVVFSMKRNGGDKYHIFTVNISGNDPPPQKTFGMDHDDITPIYAPGRPVTFLTNDPSN